MGSRPRASISTDRRYIDAVGSKLLAFRPDHSDIGFLSGTMPHQVADTSDAPLPVISESGDREQNS
jgi:hypothetical protein